MTPRFPVLAPSAMSADQRRVAEMIADGPRGGVRGPFIALLHNPALAERVQALGEHLRFGTGLPDRLVEIAVLVAARRWNCEYEWFAHEKLARKAGVPEAVIAAIAKAERPGGMSADDALVHDFCVATCRDGAPGDGDFEAVIARYDRSAALDLLALCGYYSMLAMILNAARLPLPEGAAPPTIPLAAASSWPARRRSAPGTAPATRRTR